MILKFMVESKYKDLTRFIIDFDTDMALLQAYNVGVQSTLVALTGKRRKAGRSVIRAGRASNVC